MNLDELRSVQSKERKKDSLQNLRPSFYQEVGEYIADLEDERDRVAEQVDDPFSSPEVSQLTDEIETAKDVVEAVYERRMGKLVKQASLAAAGMPADDEGLTAEEQELFADLVDRISANKSHVLDVLEGKAGDTDAGGESEPTTGTPSRPPTTADGSTAVPSTAEASDSPADRAPSSDADVPPAPPEPEPDPASAESAGGDDSSGLSPADAMGGGTPTDDDASASESPGTPTARGSTDAPEEESLRTDGADRSDQHGESDATDTDDVDRVTVKITQDLGSILGVDAREYTLATDDVVTLPEENATPLLEREAAERLE